MKLSKIISAIQVCIPFAMLHETFLERFLALKINPEIGLDAMALERFALSDFESVAARFHQAGQSITVHAPFWDLSAGSPDPAVIDLTRHRFKQMLKLIPVFKPKAVICHAGYDAKRYVSFRDAWIADSLQTWSWLADQLQEAGTQLMLENVYEHHPEDLLPLFEKLAAQKVGFCLDIGHQSAFGRAPLAAWLDQLGAFLGQIHMHDNDGKQDAHWALGRGNIPLSVIFDFLHTRQGRLPIITIEPHHKSDFWPNLAYLRKHWKLC